MSYIGSPKIIPRVHVSPKIKLSRNKKFSPIVNRKSNKFSPKRLSPKRASPKRIQPKKSPRKAMKNGGDRFSSPRTKLFRTHRESFRNKPTVNPVTNRTIKINGDTYQKLVKLYGNPY